MHERPLPTGEARAATAVPFVHLVPQLRSKTAAARALAASPLIYYAILTALFYQFRGTAGPSMTVATIATVAGCVGLAVVDRRVLRDRGYGALAPAILGIFPPAYLVVRGHSCTQQSTVDRGGYGPLFFYIVASLVVGCLATVFQIWIVAGIYLLAHPHPLH